MQAALDIVAPCRGWGKVRPCGLGDLDGASKDKLLGVQIKRLEMIVRIVAGAPLRCDALVQGGK